MLRTFQPRFVGFPKEIEPEVKKAFSYKKGDVYQKSKMFFRHLRIVLIINPVILGLMGMRTHLILLMIETCHDILENGRIDVVSVKLKMFLNVIIVLYVVQLIIEVLFVRQGLKKNKKKTDNREEDPKCLYDLCQNM